MRTAIVWLVSAICTILSPIGFIALIVIASEGDFDLLLIPAIVAPIGLLFGIFFWNETVAPRIFWVKSRAEIFNNRVGTAFNYMITFFNSACGVVGLIEYIL